MRIFLSINLLLLASCATQVDGNRVASGESCNARADRLIDEADRAADIAQDALDKAESEPTQENADAARERSLEASEKAVAAAEFKCGA
ncbi:MULTISPECIES: hypothetical protein [unclassified Pseudoxanthomonas]|uniref:hypothetical protein n=1 Tax=unclassified Pseudoxanthomonas TaxID=2645906 RepID=UPI001113E202|nr:MULTISPECIES: hypothetical protein [unclassified Pseudoxanthomonas]